MPILGMSVNDYGNIIGTVSVRDKPVTDSTSGSAYRFLLGGSTAGKPVNEMSAMQMTAVYACVRILSESIARLPLPLYRYTNIGDPSRAGSKEKAFDNPQYFLLHNEPNP